MSRSIKFRCWDVYNERVVYEPDRFEPAYTEDEKLLAPYIFYETWQDREDGIRRPCHLMQFTGLLDKHRKEIYEHDIIEYRFNSERRKGKVVYNPQLLKFIVDRGNGHDYDAVNYMNEVEVIGDIYTTPELVDPKMIER